MRRNNGHFRTLEGGFTLLEMMIVIVILGIVTGAVLLQFNTAQQRISAEEVKVGKGASFVGKTLEGSRIRQEMGVVVLAIKSENSPMRFNPPPDEVIHEGDHLIAMGDPD